LNHLNEKGTLAAVLPVGDKPEAWIGGEFVGARSGREFSGEVQESYISVSVFVFKRSEKA